MTLIVSFGRCNLPHQSHVDLINQCDIFILSNGKKNLPSELRLLALEQLSANLDKIIIGNPYKILSKLSKNTKLEIIYTDDNFSLVNNFSNKSSLRKVNKTSGLSSTLFRQLLDNSKIQELLTLIDNNYQYLKTLQELRYLELKL